MARDRKRAKQRQQRRAQRAPVPSQPRRENVPGELDHASGDVDQVEAAIVAGAGGEPAPLDEAVLDDQELAPEPIDQPLREDAVDEEPLEDDTFLEDEPIGGDAGGGGRVPTAVGQPGGRPAAEPRRDGNAVANFLRASWAELQRVQWPDRRQVAQATAVVLGFVALAGGYLGVADAVFSRFVDAIL
ncbi:MAG: preprotein translocase subunit SecE [Solirubrobacteraceae bacterium]|jgi:preprotein translocase SecE subunit|nr:preprotein translocase subunit SecE [Solirubrobacteraceae bacterium]